MGYISAHRTDRSAKHGSVVVIFHDIIVVEINELRKSANPFCEGNGTRPFGRVLINLVPRAFPLKVGGAGKDEGLTLETSAF